MKRMLAWAIGIVILSCALLPACAEPEGVDRFCGAWAGDGVGVEIWRDGDEILCRAVFRGGDGERDVWEYCACRYAEGEDALRCGGIIRTHEEYDGLLAEWTETDWAMDDFHSARFDRAKSGSGLLWSDDGLDEAIELTRREDAGETPGTTATDDE